MIRYIDRPDDRRLYRIVVTNQVTGFLTVFSVILLIIYWVEPDSNFALYFLSFTLPGFVLFHDKHLLDFSIK